MQERRRAWRRVENEIRSSFAASLASVASASASDPPQSSSPPPSTSSQTPPTPAGSNRRDEPSTSAGAPPSDEEWRWTRESTRLRARQVLSMMVESLTQFFEQHGLSQETPHAILDEQIYNLYVLLQLALELTDLLLMQLMSTRRELEEQWWHTLRVPNSEGNNSSDPSRRNTVPHSVTSMADMIALDCHHGFYRNWSRFITRLGASHFNRRIWTNNNNTNNSNNSNESSQPPPPEGTSDSPQQSSASSNSFRAWSASSNSNESPQSPPVDGASDSPQQTSGSNNPQRTWTSSRTSTESHQSTADGVPESSSSRTEQPRPRQSFTLPEVQVNDIPVAPEVASLLGEPPGGRSRARSPPPPSGIFVPVGSPRTGPMSGTSGSNVRRGRPNPFVQLHQLRRSAGSGAFLWGGVGGVGNGRGGSAEGRFRRFLHPRYVGPNPFDVEYREDLFQETTGNLFQVTPQGTFIQDASSTTQTFRIQAWDFSSCTIPEIGDGKQNVVVPVCKIHNDSSVDVSCDGRLLVALVPPGRLQINTMLGIYSLEWGNLGECLFIMSLAQDAVSVSLSPTCRHLIVGLATHRMAHLPSERNTIAQVFRLERTPPYPSPPPSSSSKGKGVGKGMRRGANNSTPNSSQVVGHLHHVREIEQRGRRSHFNLNTIRWMPGAGQGLVYGTSTGQLRVIR
ncbi:hypothetical protein J437_LFUL007816 [Ladona fulva]|uniref:Activating molecule in BECN1-regulated autophagy protein 1 n=1 Tax=Ladona fulva TaxID=123851 RepID=A0A8K0K3B6_LADFU|nr:hypothetical protein J437_LFUL007816 [Ladona fulva]